MSLNPSRVKLELRNTSVLSRTLTKKINYVSKNNKVTSNSVEGIIKLDNDRDKFYVKSIATQSNSLLFFHNH